MDLKAFRLSVRAANPAERDRATEILSRVDPGEVHVYDGLVTGLADRDCLRELTAAGLIVDRSSATRDDPPSRAAPYAEAGAASGREAEDSSAIQRMLVRGQAFSALMNRGPILELAAAGDSADDQTPEVCDVQLLGPMRPQWGSYFESNGIRITSYTPPYRYRMSLTPDQRDRLRAEDFVVSIEPYSVQDTVTPEFVQHLEQEERTPSAEPTTFDLMVHAPEQAEAVVRMIQESGQGEVETVSGRFIRLRALALSPLVAALVGRTEVKSITPYQPPVLFCDIGCALIGVPAVNAAPGGPWDGTGEIAGLIDSGVDTGHPDLHDRVKSYDVIPGATPSDVSGHGTHVAGILCGTGADSGGRIRGAAPGAELAVVGIVGAAGSPLFPPDLGTLLKIAVDHGARVVNMSLGFPQNRYDQYAESVDQFIFDHPGVLVVIAAGNRGTAKSGFPDFNTLGTPATAKNAVTVGACVSDRTGFTQTWSQYKASFAVAPVNASSMTGPPVVPAALSSRGPTEYLSIKPDLVAPGTFILSTQASNATLQSFAPVPPGTGRYFYLNGTSMAAPFVSGAAVILRHYLRAVLQVAEPSAALLKALLCASAVRCPSVMSASVEPKVGYPDFDQGAGRVDLRSILPHKDADGLRLSFQDVANGSADALQSRVPPGSPRHANRLYKVTVATGGSPLRVVLTWTDSPGRSLQNTLELDVAGPNVHLVGNHEHSYARDPLFQDLGLPGVPFDRKNSVQVVNLANAAAGEYTITVLADNTPDPSHFQGYALCVTGRLAGGLSEEAPAF